MKASSRRAIECNAVLPAIAVAGLWGSRLFPLGWSRLAQCNTKRREEEPAMTLSNRTTDELVRIAHTGGGFRLDTSGRQTEDLIRIATAARTNNATVIF